MKVYNRVRFGWLARIGFGLVVLMLGLSACMPASSQMTSTPQVAGNIIPNTGAKSTAMPMVQVTDTPGVPPAPSGSANPKGYIGLFKDNAVAVLDTVTNQVIKTIPIPVGPHGLVISPDGRWVYASSDGDLKVSLIDTQTDTVVKSIEVGKTPHGLAITPDGHTVLVAVFGTSQVVFIDTSSNTVTGQVAVPTPHNIAVSPDGHTAYVAAQKQGSTGLAVLNLDTRAQTSFITLAKVPRALSFSPDGKLLYFTLAGVESVEVLDPASNQVKAQIDVGASPHFPIFAPDGQMALVVSQGPGELYFMDPQTSVPFLSLTVGKMPHWIAMNPQGTTAWVTNEASNSISVVDLKKFDVTATIPVGNAPRKMVVQPGLVKTTNNLAPAQTSNTVVIRGMAFNPTTITIKVGQTITWVNQDSIDHTITNDQGQWDSGPVQPGKSFSITLSEAGTYTYHCSIHPFMTGKIIVTQ